MKLFKALLAGAMIGLLCYSLSFGASAVKLMDTTGTPRGLDIVEGRLIIGSEGGLTAAKDSGTNTLVIHKFGAAPDFDTGDGFVDVWDGANDASPNQMTYGWPTGTTITQVSSSSASDTGTVEVQGLDADWNLLVQSVTLTGQTLKALTTPLRRVFRLKNTGASDFVGTIYVAETITLSSGVPTDLTKVKAMVAIGNNQTLMALYTIPAGYTGYMREVYASGANGTFNNTGQSIVKLFARPPGGVFQIKHIGAINSAGTSTMIKGFVEPYAFSEKTDIALRVNSSVDASAIAGGFDIILIKNE